MTSTTDKLFDELIGSKVDVLLENDSYYQQMATKLKPASVIKQEHRELIIRQLKMNELQTQLIKAEELIRGHLAEVSPNEYKKVIDEFEHATEHLMTFTPKREGAEKDQPLLLQEILGISDHSLSLIYQLARRYAKDNEFSNARALFSYLTTLAPQHSVFWMSLGICFQMLNLDKEAVEAFMISKTLNDSEPASYIYAAESYLKLKERDKAKQEIEEVKPLLGQKDGPWKQSLEYVLQELKK